MVRFLKFTSKKDIYEKFEEFSSKLVQRKILFIFYCSFHFSIFFFFFLRRFRRAGLIRSLYEQLVKRKSRVFIFLVSIYQVSLSSWKVISEMIYTQFDSGRQVKSISALTQPGIRHFAYSYGTVVTYTTSSQFGLFNIP